MAVLKLYPKLLYPLNGFSVDEIAEISEVKSGGIWRSKSNHDRTVIRRVSG